ncbi:MAG TPA: AAA family ATPase [Alphaproteobacteria bacterium]|nr:AAA family ATPase [Alphaproteobacteria bacterium]
MFLLGMRGKAPVVTLKKLVSVNSLGRFKNYSAAGDVELSRLNLIYGENGKGKTTVCAMLRSLATGNPAAMIGRRSLGQASNPDAHILLSSGQATFKNGQWSQKVENMEIFDQTYIAENVYSGERVGNDQRKNLYRVIVGQQGVQLAEQLDKINENGRKLQADIRQKRKTLEAILGEIKVDDFLVYTAPADLGDQIAAVEKSVQIAQDSGQLKVAAGLATLVLPKTISNLELILAKSLEGVSNNAENAVKTHLAAHNMKSSDQEWLSKGMGFDAETGCPYCGQSLQDVTLIQAYKDLFSKAYRDLKQEITVEGQGVSQRFGEGIIAQLLNTIEKNDTQQAFWASQLVLEPVPPLDIKDLEASLSQYRETSLAVLRTKISAPLEELSIPQDVLDATKTFDEWIAKITTYNAAITAANQQIDKFKTGLVQADVSKAQKDLKKLQTLKSRNEPKINDLCNELIKIEKEKAALETQREQVKASLDAYGEKFTKAYQHRINAYLDNFGANFRIAEVDHNYVGGVNAKYNLVINGTSIPLGDENTPISEPSFRNTLSAGDKSTLALAFFLAQLDEDANAANKVIVFDDPFSSQDRFRRTQTQLEILTRAGIAAQTFVFSHDAAFLVDLNEKAVGFNVKALRVIPVGDEHSTISECNLSDLCKPTQLAMIESMMRYRQSGSLSGHKPEDIVQKLRPVLEAHCSNTCPTAFGATNNLGGMVGEIRDKGNAHTLFPILKDLHEINEFSKKHHHDDGSVNGPIDETELLVYSRRTLRIVGAL